jgi:hypothetical protein
VAEFHTLTANYRSSRAIIDSVNVIASADFCQQPERAFEIRYTGAEALVLPVGNERAPSGSVTIVEDDGSAPEDPNAPALLCQAEGSLRSAFVAAGLCAKIARNGSPFSEIALLARRRATLPLLELALDRLNIPFVVAGRALYATPEVRDLFAALRSCWSPPPAKSAREGMQMSVRFSFKTSGDMIGAPRLTFATAGISSEIRATYLKAISTSLEACLPLKFTGGFGGAVAGRPIAIRYVDNRPLGKQ